MLTQILNVQVSRIGLFPTIDAVQGDSGRVLECRLTDFVIPSGSTARIYAQKPSGAQIYNNAMVDGNVVSVDLTTQILAEVGKVVCQIEVDNGGERVTSFDFALNVVKSRVDGSAIESEDEFTVLEDAIDDAQKATTAANSAANAANAAASTDNTAANGANTAAGAASTAASTANSAASNADAAREEIEQKLAAGDFNASIAVGSTTTGEPGTDASVNNSGTNMDVVLDFVIPKGEKGDPGDVENISQQSITFTEATGKSPLESGDTLGVLFGKTKKYQSENDKVIYEIGGRNLILDSENAEFNAYGSASVTKESNVSVPEWGTDKAKRIYGSSGTSTISATLDSGRKYPQNGIYCMSIYVKNNGEKTISFGRSPLVTVNVEPGITERIFVSKQQTISESAFISLFSESIGETFDVTYWHPKIEIGSTPTRWTPAPEDYTTNLLDADTIQSAENLGITGETGITLLNSMLQKTFINPISEVTVDNAWNLIKYADGTFKGTRRFKGTISIAQESGAFFVSGVSNITLPSVANSDNISFASVEISSGSWPVISCLRGISDTAISYMGISTSSRAATQYDILAKIEGKITA